MDVSSLNIPLIAVQFAILLLALTVHESAHAWTSDRFGDPTARALGRVSMNPVAHIDPLGTIVFPLVAMISGAPLLGWAKPVPVNPMNLRDPRRMGLWISAAGPLSNLALAAVFLALLVFVARSELLPVQASVFGYRSEIALSPLVAVLKVGLVVNVLLAFFNLLPIPPLDGSGVLAGLLPEPLGEALERIGAFGFIILYAMILLPIGGNSLLGWLFLPVFIGLQLTFMTVTGL